MSKTVASETTSGKPMFFDAETATWRMLKLEDPETPDPKVNAAREELKKFLLSSLQMQHIAILAGSGTSLGKITKGPSMGTLWDFCVNSNPGVKEARKMSPLASKVIAEIKYEITTEKENIEALLSRCDAFLQINESTDVATFITNSKKTILNKCSEFLDPKDEQQLAAHRTFLHRLSRRRVRDSRLKLFTTNYDLCFEMAAGKQGLVVLDGFSFTHPRYFDPRFFLYDIVRRPATGDEVGSPLEGVFHLYKLHGSVNWSRAVDGNVEIVENPKPEAACLIYPAKGKYQQSYAQPHIELMSQYFSVLREPNTCLIVTGFGFNDDHLSEPILAAVRTNPHLRVIIVNPSIDDLTARSKEKNKFWDTMFNLSKQGADVWLINAYFGDFADMIPDLKSLTPAQQLVRDIKEIAKPK